MIKNLILVLTILSQLSCASKAIKYSDAFSSSDWNYSDHPESYRLYLIGDAGNAPEGQTTALLKYLKSLLDRESSNSSIIWLGDNIYPVGLAPKESPDYHLGKHRLIKQLECHDQFAGMVYFIPGNHDWYEYYAEGINRQEDLVEQYLSSQRPKHPQSETSYYLPDDACGEIHSIQLRNDLVLILMDSNWYLKDESVKEPCPQTTESFEKQLTQLIQKNINKKLIVCLHHPPYSYGSHGSRFSFKDYLFPLSQIKSSLLFPLPVSGLIANQSRAWLTEQDIRYPSYTRLKEILENELSKSKNAVVASGHEHTLQYITESGIHFIVSGAGSKESAVGLGKNAEFAVGKKGFVVLDYYPDKIEMNYIIPDDDGKSSKLVFKKIVSH